ncbi:MAG: aspartate/glutamate racemase family protein [Chloroflexota bacterium]
MNHKPAIGVLLLDTQPTQGKEPHVRDIPGTLGSDQTFAFPLIRAVVPGATPDRVMAGDLKLLPQVIPVAQELERQGVKGITSNCGFMSLYQQEVAQAVSVPVFLSSLLIVPLVYRLLRKEQKVAILTMDSHSLAEKHFTAAGWSSRKIPLVVAGMEGLASWTDIARRTQSVAPKMGQDLARLAGELVCSHPEIGALVLECTLMPPHASAIREAAGRPVFDINTLTSMVYQALTG